MSHQPTDVKVEAWQRGLTSAANTQEYRPTKSSSQGKDTWLFCTSVLSNPHAIESVETRKISDLVTVDITSRTGNSPSEFNESLASYCELLLGKQNMLRTCMTSRTQGDYSDIQSTVHGSTITQWSYTSYKIARVIWAFTVMDGNSV